MATVADGDPVQNSSVAEEDEEEEENDEDESTVTNEEEEEEAVQFTCCAHSSDLAQRQNQQRKAGQFCDLTLLFFTGERVHSLPAHRSVLSAASPFFSQRFSDASSSSSSAGTLELRGWGSAQLGPDTAEAVVEFMYTGQISVTVVNVEGVLELADRFLLGHLKTFCGEFLMKRLTLANCVSLHSLSQTYALERLGEGATALIRKNFHKVIHNKEFCSLPFELLRDWLSDSEIAVNSEHELFEVIVRWVNSCLEEREKHFEEMFGLLRLTQLTPAYLTRVVRKESLVANNAACFQLVADAIEVLAISLENLKLCDVGLYSSYLMKLNPRFGQNLDVILVVGGISENGEHLSECVGYFVAEDRWVNLPHIHSHHDRHAIAATDEYVYIAGSVEPGFAKAVERYDPCNNTWESVSSLSARKHSFGLACVQNSLYSIGGHGNFSPGFKDVDVYNNEQDQWYSLEPAPQILRDVKTVVIEGRFLYMMARTPLDVDEDDGLRTVTICYDTHTSKWQEVTSLPLIDSYCTFQMALACSNFYNTASFCPKSYDVANEEAQQKITTSISEDILNSLPPEVMTLEGASVCFLGEDIFVIGGWKASGVDKQCRKEAYRYCAERKRWMLLPPMPQSRCRAAASHVRVPFKFLHGNQRFPVPQNLNRPRDRFQHLQYLHRRTLTLRRQLQSQIEC